MHYEVEVRTTAGEWLGIQKRDRLLGDAALKTVRAENRGCAARIVHVAGDGAREVVEARISARISGRAAARVRSGGGPSCAPIRRSLVAHRRSLR